MKKKIRLKTKGDILREYAEAHDMLFIDVDSDMRHVEPKSMPVITTDAAVWIDPSSESDSKQAEMYERYADEYFDNEDCE